MRITTLTLGILTISLLVLACSLALLALGSELAIIPFLGFTFLAVGFSLVIGWYL